MTPDPKPFAPTLPWRCFHCDEVFHDAANAILHFGQSLYDQPACLLDEGGLKALRDAEAELTRYRNEDSDVDREIMALKSSHATALIREEEKGYARGLADGRNIPPASYMDREWCLARARELAEAHGHRVMPLEHIWCSSDCAASIWEGADCDCGVKKFAAAAAAQEK